jgi:hypothetical protein
MLVASGYLLDSTRSDQQSAANQTDDKGPLEEELGADDEVDGDFPDEEMDS